MYTLFLSSILMTLGHLPFIVVSHEAGFIKYVYMTGCATNLVNHYFQSKNRALRVLDRTVMVLGAVNDLFYIHDSVVFSYWVLSIYFYTYSKIFKNLGHHENVVPFHVLSHIFVTVCHANILVSGKISLHLDLL
jgi:hypothetical protein